MSLPGENNSVMDNANDGITLSPHAVNNACVRAVEGREMFFAGFADLGWSDPWFDFGGRSSPGQCFGHVQTDSLRLAHASLFAEVTLTAEVNGAVNATVNQAFCVPFTQNDLGFTRYYSLYIAIQCLEQNLCRRKTQIIALQALLSRKPSATPNPERH